MSFNELWTCENVIGIQFVSPARDCITFLLKRKVDSDVANGVNCGVASSSSWSKSLCNRILAIRQSPFMSFYVLQRYLDFRNWNLNSFRER